MRATSLLRRLPVLTLAVLATSACSREPEPGSILVEYVLGNNKTCAEVGVERLELTVFQGDIEDPSVSYEESELCNDDGTLSIDGITPGVYSVWVVGEDKDGVAIFDNLGQSASERNVEIFDDAEATVAADLTARPANLRIRWRLGADGFGNCGGVGIDRFEITAYEVGGGIELLSTTLDCDAVGDENGYRHIDDPERLLNGSRFGEVGVQPLNASGGNAGSAAAFIFDPVGAGYDVALDIECTVDGCTAT